MPNLHLSFSYDHLLAIVAAVTALAAGWFVYRTTVPPVPRATRWFLSLLRGLSLALLFTLIGEPLLSLVSRSTEPPVVVVLVDNSRSMTIHDAAGDRRESLLAVVQSPPLQHLNSKHAVRWSLFDRRARKLEHLILDSLTLSGEATDIAAALRHAKEEGRQENLQAIVLISDGAFNAGNNPAFEAERLGIPVFAVGVGDAGEQQDVMIRRVVTNTITYVKNRVPVNLTIRSSGYGGERVEVTVREGGTVLDRSVLTLQEGTREYTVALTLVPEREGMHPFTAEVSRLPNEITFENNRSTFFIKVLEAKVKVALIAGGPSPDVAFLRRALEADENIAVETFIERGGGSYYEGTPTGAALSAADCLVLVGFPGPQTPPPVISAVNNAAAAGRGVFFVVSRTMDFNRLRSLEPHLPFTVQGGTADEYQAFLAVAEGQRNSPLMNLDIAGISDPWSQLPPLFKLRMDVRAKPEAEVLGRARIQTSVTNEPLLVSRNINRRKSLAVLGYGLWRWTMMADQPAVAENLLEQFMSRSIRWLTTTEDERRVRVQPVSESFPASDVVEFQGQVYDENFRPIDGAQVNVTVSKGDERTELTLTPLGSGQYEGAMGPLAEGEYRFTAIVTRDGTTIGEDRGSFSVGGLNLEFFDTRMNRELLEQIAHRTGGRYYDAVNIDRLAEDILALATFAPREVVHSQEFELWNRAWMLALVVGLFALEWFVRKRHGML